MSCWMNPITNATAYKSMLVKKLPVSRKRVRAYPHYTKHNCHKQLRESLALKVLTHISHYVIDAGN